MADSITVDLYLGKLTAAFPTDLPSKTIKIYEDYLVDIPNEDLKIAVEEIIANNKFFPKVAEIREMASQIQLRRQGIPSAADAWAEVARQMREKGYYNAPEWSHPLIEEAMRAVGGWTHLTGAEVINMETVRAQYMRIYESMVSRVRADMNILPDTRKWLEERKPERSAQLAAANDEGQARTMGATIQALAGKMAGR